MKAIRNDTLIMLIVLCVAGLLATGCTQAAML